MDNINSVANPTGVRNEHNIFENLDILISKVIKNERYISNIEILTNKLGYNSQREVGSSLLNSKEKVEVTERTVNSDLLYLIEKLQIQQSELGNIQRRLVKSLGQGEILQDTSF